MHFFNPSGVDRKTNIWGSNILGGILACTNRAKANTIGITMVPYRKHVWYRADWTFFRFYQLENLEKARKMERRVEEINIFLDTLKKTILQWFWVLGSGF